MYVRGTGEFLFQTRNILFQLNVNEKAVVVLVDDDTQCQVFKAQYLVWETKHNFQSLSFFFNVFRGTDGKGDTTSNNSVVVFPFCIL